MYTRVYTDIDSMWRDTLIMMFDSRAQALTRWSQPSRAGDIAGEVLGYSAVLEAGLGRTFLRSPTRQMSPAYCAAEVLWCLSGLRSAQPLSRYAPSYVRLYAEENGEAWGAYGPRVLGQLQYALKVLKAAPHSRQAAVICWNELDLAQAQLENSKKDLPCLISWQFMLRQGKLHMMTNMRSNDAWLGFPCDVFAFTCIQRLMAAHLDVKVGNYYHYAATMHLYERYKDRAWDACREADIPRYEPSQWKLDDTFDSMRIAVELEQELRTFALDGKVTEHWLSRYAALGSMGKDLVSACAQRVAAGAGVPQPNWSRLRCTYT